MALAVRFERLEPSSYSKGRTGQMLGAALFFIRLYFATGHFEGVYLRKRKSPLAGVVWDYLDPQAPNRQAFP